MSKIDMVEFVGYHSPKGAAVEGSYSFIHVLGTQQLKFLLPHKNKTKIFLRKYVSLLALQIRMLKLANQNIRGAIASEGGRATLKFFPCF